MAQESSNPKKRSGGSPKKSRGSTAVAFVFGMVFGLLIALGVALFVSKSSVSFSAANTPAAPQAVAPKVSSNEGGALPDPNAAIHSKINAKPDLVTSVTQGDPTGQTGAPQAAPPAAQPDSKPVSQAMYFLQLGSFKNRDDAEQLRAKLAFLGTESEVSVGEVNGTTVNRVRVGPFSSANAAYQARVPLTKGGFDAAVVKE